MLDSARQKRDQLRFRRRYGFWPPPAWSDMSGYEPLMDAIIENGVLGVPGDFVEIGAPLGGGSYKLARLLERTNKRLIVVDVFDPEFDRTTCESGATMASVYAGQLRGRSQLEVFKQVTRGLPNITTMVGDSASVALPTPLAFGFIDGNHDAAYVRGDFERIWDQLSPGGLVAFHDYDHDLPHVTRTIHELVGEHASEIKRAWAKHILFFA